MDRVDLVQHHIFFILVYCRKLDEVFEYIERDCFEAGFRVLAASVEVLDDLVLLDVDLELQIVVSVPAHFHIQIRKKSCFITFTLSDTSNSSSLPHSSAVYFRLVHP